MDHKPVTENFAVCPQITPDDVETIRALGYVAIINNRPDDETPGQPTNAEIEAKAKAAGLAYYHLPIISGTLPIEAIEETRALINSVNGPAFAFCRTGTRSITLWALSQKGARPAEEIIASVAAAGYDLPYLVPFLGE